MNTDTYYEKAGMTAQQIETIKQFDMLSNPKMRVGMVIWAAITLVYLLWIRKFFVNTPDQQTSPFD